MLFAVSVLAVLGLVAGYLKNVTAHAVPEPAPARRQLSRSTVLDELLARCAFPPAGTPVTCAFSGGPDSTALLALAAAAGLDVAAVHVDHGLRPTSGAEAEQAVALGAALGVPVRVVRVDRGRRAQPRGAGPGGPPRRAAAGRADRPHRRRPGRDRADQPAAGRRARRAGGDGPRTRRGRCCGSGGARRRPCARHLGLRRRSTMPPTATVASCATGSVTSCCRCSTTSPGATSCRCWSGRPTWSPTTWPWLDSTGAGARPHATPAPSPAAPPAAARRAAAPVAGRRRLPARCGQRQPGAGGRRRARRACELAGGRRVERHRQRLRIVDARGGSVGGRYGSDAAEGRS